MKDSRQLLIGYLVATIAIPFVLLYPTLIYLDLAGMGGYDGFASPEMMKEYGAWSPVTNDHAPIYLILGGLSIVWLLSLVNLPVALIVLIGQVTRKGKGQG
jgi:hypothetical protein